MHAPGPGSSHSLLPMESTLDHLELLANRHASILIEVKQFLAGGLAGCAAKTAVAPLSRVTVLMQVQSMRQASSSSAGQILRTIVREESWTGLWTGNTATVVHRFPYAAVTFGVNGVLRKQLDGRWSFLVPKEVRPLVAGGCGAALAVVTCHPLDVVKTRLMTQQKLEYYSGILDALRKIYQQEGRAGLYRGLSVSVFAAVPTIAINFTLYDHFYKRYSNLGLPMWPFTHALLAGASSGATASTFMFPFDLVRRQMQLVGVGGKQPIYNGVWQAACRIFQVGTQRAGKPGLYACLLGLREFFRGLAPELLKVTPHSAIMFCVHNQLMTARWPLEV